MKTLLSGLFGGGSSIIYVAALGGAFAFYIHYQDIKDDLKDARTEITRLEGEAASKDDTIRSQARTAERRSAAQSQLDDTEDEINDLPETRTYPDSPAFLYYYRSVYNDQTGVPDDNNGEQPADVLAGAGYPQPGQPDDDG